MKWHLVNSNVQLERRQWERSGIEFNHTKKGASEKVDDSVQQVSLTEASILDQTKGSSEYRVWDT